MTSPVLPQDVFDEIISQLTDKTTLKSCSLVCCSFRHSAQKILFRSVVVVLENSDDYYKLYYSPSEPFNFVSIVNGAPHLIEYIHDLKIEDKSAYDPELEGDIDDYPIEDLTDALSIFSRKGAQSLPINLRSLCLEGLVWRCIPTRLQDALVLLMTVHSLRNFTLHRQTDCPAKLVQNLPPLLKYLSMTSTTFSSLPTARNELPKLESLTIVRLRHLSTGGIHQSLDQSFIDCLQRIVNITQLKTLNVDVYKNSMPLIGQILLPTSNSLERLTFQFDTTNMDPVPIDLNRFSHLADITIDIVCYVTRTLSLISPAVILITRMMKKISHRNAIQNLSFCLSLASKIRMVDFKSAMKDVWQELDMICFIPQLASSKSFRGITFIIQPGFSDLVRSRLPETQKANKLHIKKTQSSRAK